MIVAVIMRTLLKQRWDNSDKVVSDQIKVFLVLKTSLKDYEVKSSKTWKLIVYRVEASSKLILLAQNNPLKMNKHDQYLQLQKRLNAIKDSKTILFA